MKKIFIVVLITIGCVMTSLAQAPNIEWQKCLGGSGGELISNIQPTTDGGYIVSGQTSSNDGDAIGSHGSYDIWIVKLNSSGVIQWQKCLGGSGEEFAYQIQSTSDSGYLIMGITNSSNGNVIGYHGNSDIWVVKLNSLGVLQWQKVLGGSNYESINNNVKQDYVHSTTDGGFIISGITTDSNDGDVNGYHGTPNNPFGRDLWVLKLNSIGTIQWQRSLGGSRTEEGPLSQATFDGGMIVSGFTYSNDGDVSGLHGNNDIWVVKLNSSGVIQWQKCLGGSGEEYVSYIQVTSDGGYIVSGYTASNDGDVSGLHGYFDIWVVKLNSSGVIQWQKCLGGSGDEYFSNIQPTADGGYIVSGQTSSNDGDVSGYHGGGFFDIWLVKLSSMGTIQWQKCLGGTNYENAVNMQITADGGYIVSGETSSNDGDAIGSHGNSDIWLIKLNSSGVIQWQKCLGGSNYENAGNMQITADGGYIIAESTNSNDGDISGNHGGDDIWVVKLAGTPTGIKENPNNTSISVYPNPSKGIITLQSDDKWVGNTIRIFNTLGKEVYQTTILQTAIEIDTKQLGGQGLYVINVEKPDHVIIGSQKIIVQ